MSNESSLLSWVRQKVVVDVDSMDPAVVHRHSSENFGFSGLTSNQGIVFLEVSKPDRTDFLTRACQGIKDTVLDVEQQVETALTILTVLLAKEVYPWLSGKINVQISPSAAYSTEETIYNAKKLVEAFEGQGIPRSRVCIKIPATPESLVGCQYLEKMGISTLATCLFNLPQAVAASQAGCCCISPYFNELRVHFEPNVWLEYKDPAQEHPMSSVISSIVRTFKELGSNTLVMPASIVSGAEAIALTSLGPDRLTLSASVLDELAASSELPETLTSIGGRLPAGDGTTTQSFPDYLKNGGQAIRQALLVDPDASRKLAEALAIFGEMEEKTKKLLRDELAK